MNILIKNVQISTMVPNAKEIEHGCIAVEKDTIAYIGEETDLPLEFRPEKVIDGEGKLALPGFINAHTHSAMTLFRGYADDVPLEKWLSKVWPLEDNMEADDAYWLSQLAIAEMIGEGITTFADMYMFMDQTAKAVEQSGIRAALARGLQGTDGKSEKRMVEARRLWQDWNGQAEGRIRVMVGPHALYTCDLEYLERCVDLAAELDAMLHIHVAETAWEFDECMERNDKTPVEYLADAGVFDVRTLAAHCVHITDSDIDVLYEKGVQVAYCPSSNMKLASGFAPVVDMLNVGVNVALGTDSAASNNSLSIIKEMTLAALVNKAIRHDPTVIDAGQALDMATRRAAAAIGWEDEIGCLAEGMKADIILINMNASHYIPKGNAITNLVYSGNGADVDTVMVNGKIIMEKREIKTMDVGRIHYEADKIKRRLMNRL